MTFDDVRDFDVHPNNQIDVKPKLPLAEKGAIDYRNDVDWFAIPLAAGASYSFHVSHPSVRFSIFDEHSWWHPDRKSFLEEGAILTAPATEVRYFHLFAPGNDSLDYAFSVHALDDLGDSMEIAKRLSLPQTLAGALATPDDEDWLTFRTRKGLVYRITATSEGLGDLGVTMFGADGESIVNPRFQINDGKTKHVDVVAETSDHHFIRLNGPMAEHMDTGGFTLSVEIPYGDANLDGKFDSNDSVFVGQRGHYNAGLRGQSVWRDGDWNGDGEFDSFDLVIALRDGNYQRTVASVPDRVASNNEAGKIQDIPVRALSLQSNQAIAAAVDAMFIEHSPKQKRQKGYSLATLS